MASIFINILINIFYYCLLNFQKIAFNYMMPYAVLMMQLYGFYYS